MRYELAGPHDVMEQNQSGSKSRWHKEVRAPFWKVMAWDTLFFILGIGVGAGVGAFLVVGQ